MAGSAFHTTALSESIVARFSTRFTIAGARKSIKDRLFLFPVEFTGRSK